MRPEDLLKEQEDAAEGWIVFGSCCSDDAGPEFPRLGFRVYGSGPGLRALQLCAACIVALGGSGVWLSCKLCVLKLGEQLPVSILILVPLDGLRPPLAEPAPEGGTDRSMSLNRAA